MNRTLAIAGKDLVALSALSVGIGPTVGSQILIQAVRPVVRLAEHPLCEGSAAVIFLDGTENVGDLLSMFKSNPGVPFVFLVPSFPPHAPVARLVSQHGGTILPAGEAPVVVAATLLALLSRPSVVAV